MSKLAENIKTYRQKHHLSQSDFARKLFVTKQAVSKWETGKGYPDSALIPKIAEVMDMSIDSLMGEKRRHKLLIPFLIVIPLLLLLTIVLSPMVSNYRKQAKEYTVVKTTVEEIIEIDIPPKGELVTADFENWQSFGNSIAFDHMAYFVFDDSTQVSWFVSDISNSDQWTTNLDQSVIDVIPTNLQNYATIGDYYLIYNVLTKTYNDVPALPGEYDCVFLIYQIEHQRLIVLDFSIQIEEGE